MSRQDTEAPADHTPIPWRVALCRLKSHVSHLRNQTDQPISQGPNGWLDRQVRVKESLTGWKQDPAELDTLLRGTQTPVDEKHIQNASEAMAWPCPSWAVRDLTGNRESQASEVGGEYVTWSLWEFLDQAIQRGKISLKCEGNPLRDVVQEAEQGRPSSLIWPALPLTWLAGDNMWATDRTQAGATYRRAQRMLDTLAVGTRSTLAREQWMAQAGSGGGINTGTARWVRMYARARQNPTSALEQTLAAWLLIRIGNEEGSPTGKDESRGRSREDVNPMGHPWVIANGADVIHRMCVLAEAMINVPALDGAGNARYIELSTKSVLTSIATIIDLMERQDDKSVWNDTIASETWHDVVERLTPLMMNGRASAYCPLRGEANKAEIEKRLLAGVPELFVRMERHALQQEEPERQGLARRATRRL